MADENLLTILDDEDKSFLKSKTPAQLPDNPSDKKWSASQIKAKMYEGYLVLFEWLRRAINETDEVLVDLNDNQDNFLRKNYTFSSDTLLSTIISTIGEEVPFIFKYSYDSRKYLVDYKMIGSSNIQRIKFISLQENKCYFKKNFSISGVTLADLISSENELETADKDWASTEIAKMGKSLGHSLSGNGTQWTFKFSLYDADGNKIDEETQVFGGATTVTAGLLSAADKIKIDNIASDIATALATAEGYTDAKVARANLVSVLGEASQSLNGLMSATDKTRLDTLFALLGENADGDTVVNTINEVLAIFDQYPEGTTIVNALSAKVNTSDIIDDLTSDETTKPLSAAQGKALKQGLDAYAGNLISFETKNFSNASISVQFEKNKDFKVVNTSSTTSCAFTIPSGLTQGWVSSCTLILPSSCAFTMTNNSGYNIYYVLDGKPVSIEDWQANIGAGVTLEVMVEFNGFNIRMFAKQIEY